MNWKPYGSRQRRVRNETVLTLSHAQADALAELSSSLKPTQRLGVQQTSSETGGRHLYVRLPDGTEMHVANTGRVTLLGLI